jgi:hypothetical protein
MADGAAGASGKSSVTGSFTVKAGLAQMLKGACGRERTWNERRHEKCQGAGR